jgi:putative peptide maturation system protein
MTTSRPSAVLEDALDYLRGLATDAAVPSVARERLQTLRERHPDMQPRLVWQREEYDGSLQYEVLVTQATGDVITLAYCPARTLPWSFRGGHRASERVLLRVNGVSMELDQAIACLDFLWDEAALADLLIRSCLVREALEQEPVALSPERHQWAMDAFRRARGLLSATTTAAWMAHRGISHGDLERLVAAEATVAELRQRKTAGDIDGYFEAHRQQLSTVHLASLTFLRHEVALDVVQEIQSGADFFAVAERSLARGLLATPTSLFRLIRLDELSEAVAVQVVGASPGAVVGPFATADGHTVIRVISVADAVLDAATRCLIERRLFDRWLDTRRQSARVEWFWGSATRIDGFGQAAHDARVGSRP